MNKFVFALTLLCASTVLWGSTVALADSVAVLPRAFPGGLDVQASGLLRYSYDPASGMLTLSDTALGVDAQFPPGTVWQQRGRDLVLLPPPGSTFTLSPDGKRLSVRFAPPEQASSPAVALAEPEDPARAALVPLVVPLSNAEPRALAGLLTRLYSNLRVEVDERSRTLVVLVGAKDRELVRALIARLDQERAQVMFEAEILEVNQDVTQDLGFEYDKLLSFKLTESTPKGVLSLGRFSRDGLGLTVGLRALKNNGAARILAQPRVTTLDGVEARLNSTQTTPILTTAGGTSSVQSITTGITLKLTPRVAPDGTVEAALNISVSTQTGTTPSGLPQFSTREASTTVRVKNGEPIAIGGLLETRTLTSQQKVPILGDIPLLGLLFTSDHYQTHHTDLVIIVTPRLVRSPSMLSGSGDPP